ncbi:Histone deacetylase 6 [Plecturocebus cupreus]
MEKKGLGARVPTGRQELGGASQGRSLRKGCSQQRRSRQNPQSSSQDSTVTSKRNIKKGAVPRSIPNLAEVKKKGKMKKLGQAIEEGLIVGLQGMDLNLEAEALAGTGLVLDEQLNEFHCLWDDSFPEGPERLHAIKEQLIQEGLLDRCVSFQARFAEKEELMLVHSLEYIDLMETTQYMKEGELRVLADTYDSVYLHPNSYSCACLATGSVLRLVDAVLGAEIRNGMAIIRPPGHHAQHSLMDGYCMFNHVAVAARYAQQKHRIRRVLIVDWDVHHGQGTQFAFDQDSSVLYFSIHRYEQGRFWPHLKASNWSTTGFGQGQGYTINVPWNQVGMRDADYIAAFLHILLPVALEVLGFQPQLVLVAAGFDALQGDPKGEMAATPAGFAQLTHLLMGLAGGKLILSLEGGYNLRALAEGVSASLHTLLGDPCPMLESPGAPCQSAQASVSCALEALEPFWEILVRSTETVEGDNVEEDNVEEIEDEGPWEPPVLPILTWPVLQSRTGLVYDQSMMNHCNLWDSHHPEVPQRISRIMCRLEELGLAGRCLTLPPRPATEAELFTCHSAEYVARLRATEKMKTRELHRESSNFDSIYICPSTFACAQLATGAACRLVEAVLSREVLNGAAVVRPPGHHAEQDAACGFCFFNSVAVAARHAQAISGHALRILIVDWDVHHGNGTQHMFEDDPSVLYVSLHRYDHGTFFPMGDEGASSQIGRAAGTGFTVNVAWNGPRIGDADYLAAWHRLVLPIAYEFNPELVLVSAGFDAARGDPLGGCQVSPEGYAHLTHLLMGLASGRIILILEGGYNLTSISESMAACTRSLLGDPPPLLTLPRPPLSGALASITETIQVHRRYWRSLRVMSEWNWGPQGELREGGGWGAGIRGRKGDSTHTQGSPSLVPEVEDKEGPSSSKPITKKTPQPAKPTLAEEMITREKVLEASMGKVISVSGEESTPDQIKLETAVVAVTQDQSSEAATGGATLAQTISKAATGGAMLGQTTSEEAVRGATPDQTTSEETVGGATLDQTTSEDAVRGATLGQTTSEAVGGAPLAQTTSEAAMEGATLDQTTSEEALGGTELIQTPLTLSTDHQISPTSPVQGTTPQISPSALIGSLRTLELGSESQGAPESQAPGENLLGEAAGGQDMADWMLMQGSKGLTDQAIFYAVTPLPWCPHLVAVCPIPAAGLDVTQPCGDCGTIQENWVCLSCYQVYCGRYINAHMLRHHGNSGHPLVLSYVDLSTWCYYCEAYIHHQALLDVKNIAHQNKFGEDMPHPH